MQYSIVEGTVVHHGGAGALMRGSARMPWEDLQNGADGIPYIYIYIYIYVYTYVYIEREIHKSLSLSLSLCVYIYIYT